MEHNKSTQGSYCIPTTDIKKAVSALEKERPTCQILDNFPVLCDENIRLEVHKFKFVQADCSTFELDKTWAMCRMQLTKAVFQRFQDFPNEYKFFDFRIWVIIDTFEAELAARTVTGMRTDNKKKFENALWNLINAFREKILDLMDRDYKKIYTIEFNLVVTRDLAGDKQVFYVN